MKTSTCALLIHPSPVRSTTSVVPRRRGWKFKKGDKLIAKRPRTVQYPLIKIKEAQPDSDSYMCWGRNARFPLKRQFVEDHYQLNVIED